MDVELCLTKQSLPFLVRLTAVEFVSTWGLQPETFISRLSRHLGGRISHCVDSNERIGTDYSHIDLLKRGYKLSRIGKAPKQRIAACNTTISAKASNILNTEVQELLRKGAISEVRHLHGQYVSSDFSVPKSKMTPDKWRPILKLKKSNKYICHVHFQMEDPKLSEMVPVWFHVCGIGS